MCLDVIDVTLMSLEVVAGVLVLMQWRSAVCCVLRRMQAVSQSCCLCWLVLPALTAFRVGLLSSSSNDNI